MANRMFAALVAAAVLTASALGQCPGGVCPMPPAGYQQPSRPSSTIDPAARRVMGTICQSVVRVRHVSRGVNGASLGSATLIAHSETASYYITCAHIFDDGPGQTTVLNREAHVIELDRANDLALLQTARVTLAAVETIDHTGDRSGELTALGLGPDGRRRCVQGAIAGYATAQGATDPSVKIRGMVRPGDSGGGLFDLRGRLCGVVWGAQGGETYCMVGRPVRRILYRVRNLIAPNHAPLQCPAVAPPRNEHSIIDSPRGGRRVVDSPPPSPPAERPPASSDDGCSRCEAWQSETTARLDRFEDQLGKLAGAATKIAEQQAADRTTINQELKALALRVGSEATNDPRVAGLASRMDKLEAAVASQPAASEPQIHYTLVADSGADYWPRLSDEYRRARQAYQGLKLSPPPPSGVGQLPRLVEWRDATPTGNIGGVRTVSEALLALSQGRRPTVF